MSSAKQPRQPTPGAGLGRNAQPRQSPSSASWPPAKTQESEPRRATPWRTSHQISSLATSTAEPPAPGIGICILSVQPRPRSTVKLALRRSLPAVRRTGLARFHQRRAPEIPTSDHLNILHSTFCLLHLNGRRITICTFLVPHFAFCLLHLNGVTRTEFVRRSSSWMLTWLNA
jgi:hypothetical protein